MKAPTRLKYDDAAGERARTLLANAAPPRHMTHEQRRRAVERAAKLASIPVAASALLWAKGVAIASVAALSLAAADKLVVSKPWAAPRPSNVATIEARLSRHLPALRQAVGAHDAEAPRAVPSEHVPAVHVPAVGSVPARSSSSAAAAAAPPSKDDPLAREAALLETARAALESDPARAIAALDAHAREFPRGQLAPEREVLRIDALRRLGRVSEAAERGSAVLSEGSSRLYQQRVRKVLDAPPAVAPNR